MAVIEWKHALFQELSFRTFSTQNLDPGHYLSFRSSAKNMQQENDCQERMFGNGQSWLEKNWKTNECSLVGGYILKIVGWN